MSYPQALPVPLPHPQAIGSSPPPTAGSAQAVVGSFVRTRPELVEGGGAVGFVELLQLLFPVLAPAAVQAQPLPLPRPHALHQPPPDFQARKLVRGSTCPARTRPPWREGVAVPQAKDPFPMWQLFWSESRF